VRDSVIWHDLECASYTADLPLWRELAEQAHGPVLDLGAGTGRVTLDLAARGHDVTALDSDGELLDELARRAEADAVEVVCVRADARSLPETTPFALAIAPMQLLQIMGGPAGRSRLLQGVRAALAAGGLFAAAVTDLDEAVAPDDGPPPLPDVKESGRWVFSSIPLDVRPHPEGIMVEWLRRKVSPVGELTEERHAVVLEEFSPDRLEREAAEHGFRAAERRDIAPTRDYVGSTVLICRR
jgi:SAM-dependent methyltransferase